jgi:hypothetical protein
VDLVHPIHVADDGLVPVARLAEVLLERVEERRTSAGRRCRPARGRAGSRRSSRARPRRRASGSSRRT